MKESRNSRKRRKRREVANKAADAEMAEISLEQHMLELKMKQKQVLVAKKSVSPVRNVSPQRAWKVNHDTLFFNEMGRSVWYPFSVSWQNHICTTISIDSKPATRALISQRGYAGWSGSALSANYIRAIFGHYPSTANFIALENKNIFWVFGGYTRI